MTVDVNRGLPELPEGYFWRVTAEEWTNVFNEVVWVRKILLMKKRDKPLTKFQGWWHGHDRFSYKLEEAQLGKWDEETNFNEVLLRKAETLLAKREFEMARDKAANLFATKYVGDYPPKKLGAA